MKRFKSYNVIFTLYGGIKGTVVQASSKEEAIEKAKKKNGLLPVHFVECVECE